MGGCSKNDDDDDDDGEKHTITHYHSTALTTNKEKYVTKLEPWKMNYSNLAALAHGNIDYPTCLLPDRPPDLDCLPLCSCGKRGGCAGRRGGIYSRSEGVVRCSMKVEGK